LWGSAKGAKESSLPSVGFNMLYRGMKNCRAEKTPWKLPISANCEGDNY